MLQNHTFYYSFVAASWYKEDVMTLMDEALRYGGLTTLSDSYAINGEPGDFYPCSRGKRHEKYDHLVMFSISGRSFNLF